MKELLLQKKREEKEKQAMVDRQRRAAAEKEREEAKYANEVIPDTTTLLKQFMGKKGKKNIKELWRQINKKLGETPNELAATVEEFSKEFTKHGLFTEAKEFTKLAAANLDLARVLREASRVCFVMQNYLDAIEYLQRAATAEQDNNAETFSDIARCIHLMGDKERAKTEGIDMTDKALKINPKCANAWLNKGNIKMSVQDLEAAK